MLVLGSLAVALGMIRRTNQRSNLDMLNPQAFTNFFVFGKLIGVHPFFNRMMHFGRLHVLPKGIEQDTFMTMSQVMVEVLDRVINSDQIGVLYGPSHAEEVAHEKPTTVVAASYSTRTATYIQNTCMTPMFRIYVNNDVLGVEIGGSVKNIMAIAAGVIDGAGWGDNTKAALITRGLHEIKRMGVRFGAHTDTFSGLTGMGDLIVTCTSEHSRNRRLGLEIGRGKSLDDIIGGMHMVAEGVKTTRAVYFWAQKYGVEMPITTAIYQVLFEGMNPVDALNDLMNRDPKQEGLQDIYS